MPLTTPPQQDQYKIRRAFVSEPGKSLIVADYGQLELRLLAHITKCQSMINVRAGVRALACVFGFGVVYGVGEGKRRLGLAYSLSLNSSPTRNINSTNHPKPPPQNQKPNNRPSRRAAASTRARLSACSTTSARRSTGATCVILVGWFIYVLCVWMCDV